MKGLSMDRYTKTLLTIIAVGIIGINIHLFGDKIITPAHAVGFQDYFNSILNKQDQALYKLDIIISKMK